MSDPLVLISTVADGSMYDRKNPENSKIIKNREAYLKKHDLTMEQTTRAKVSYDRKDFTRYVEVNQEDKGKGMRDNVVVIADGLVTREKNHALLLPVADCIGAVFYDPEHELIMLSHLGRHSLEQEGGIKSVEFLVRNYGSNPKLLKVWLTPAPGKDVYPIWALDNKGMKEVCFEQLDTAGILPEHITDNPADSTKDPNYFSYSEYLKGNRAEDGDHVMIAMMRD